MTHKILVTGAATAIGKDVVRALAEDPSIDSVVGLGADEPVAPLAGDRTAAVGLDYASLTRVLDDEAPDTVVHLSVANAAGRHGARRVHEINVIGTMNLLAAAGRPGSSVRHVVLRSSTAVYGAGPRDPAFFDEDAPVARTGSALAASFVEAEGLAAQFASENPATSVTVLRVVDVAGPEPSSPLIRNLSRRFSPSILGYDPLLQFVSQTDVVRAVAHVTTGALPGTFNVAGDGVLPLSEVAARCGTRLVPVPPIKSSLFVEPLIRLGLLELPPELAALLRYGRGVSNQKLVRTGFEYRATSGQAVGGFAGSLDRDGGRRRSTPRETGTASPELSSDPPTDPAARPA